MNPYDEVPYQRRVTSDTDPQRLAMLATLFGMAPASPRQARVLELGCASGDNLIPLAASYPGSRFLGIDLSRVQVEQGQSAVGEMGLANLELRHADLAAFAAEREGPFDYILCHGVWSWVGEAERLAILRTCRQGLAPQGVAYISYNCYPGWKTREIVRDAMVFHAATRTTPEERAGQARAMLELMVQAAPPASVFGRLLAVEAEHLRGVRNEYLLHDHLEATNAPCYFTDFMRLAHQHELGYLGEARVDEMVPEVLGERIAALLREVSGGDLLALEQYIDFLRNRTFRRTLLVHAELARTLRREIAAPRLAPFHFGGMLRHEETRAGQAGADASAAATTSGAGNPSAPEPQPGPRLERRTEETFVDGQGHRLSSAEPLIKAAIQAVGEAWPESMTPAEWLARARLALGPPPSPSASPSALPSPAAAPAGSDGLFDDVLVKGFAGGLFFARLEPLRIGRAGEERPLAFLPARYLAGRKVREVPNLWHQLVVLGDLFVELLPLVDGTRTRAELAAVLVERCLAGQLRLPEAAGPAPGEQGDGERYAVEQAAGRSVDVGLRELERMALLMPAVR